MAVQALTGSLSHFNLAHVLRLLQTTRSTGHLELQRGDECTDLFVEDGRSLFARTTGVSLRVGDILVRRGELRPEAIELVLAFQQDQPGTRLGRMLVDNGVLTEAQIRDALLVVQRHIVVAALRWRTGSFRFGADERLTGEDVRLDLDVDELLCWPMSVADPRDDRRARAA
jgi:hypothetical protein